MDYISAALAKSGLPAAIEAANRLLEKLTGPVAEEAGLFLQDKVREYRLRNQLNVLGKTQDALNKAGVEPKSVPLRILVPLLEGAALQDDDDLATKWAALLATASASGHSVNMIPSFSNVLSQLSPTEVRLLDALLKERWYHESSPQNIQLFALSPTLQKAVNLSDHEYDLSVDNLVRLGLCVTSIDGFPVNVQQKFRQLCELDHKLVRRDVLIATQFGVEFLKACYQPPEKKE